MLVTGFPAGALAANCYLVAVAPGEPCVIIDPGQDAQPGIEELIERYRLQPIAVLLTHGHLDHMWSVAPVCGARGIPAYIHTDDREMLSNPGKALDLLGQQSFLGGRKFSEPDDVRALSDGEVVTLAGLDFSIGHTPGHTEGSVTFRSTAEDPGGGRELDALFTGDLLFAGSIGRTDLPGGDHAAILKSLSRTLTLPDETVVLPGHGPTTTIGDERRTNPFLTGIAPAQKGL